jgi:hypothetical protein
LKEDFYLSDEVTLTATESADTARMSMRAWPTWRDASVEPSEHHKQSDKDDGADQDPGGSRVHASLLSIDAVRWLAASIQAIIAKKAEPRSCHSAFSIGFLQPKSIATAMISRHAV